MPTLPAGVPGTRGAVGWVLAVALPGLATGIGVLLLQVVDLSTDVVLSFPVTVVVALVGGLGPAVAAALVGGLLLDFFLTPPTGSLTAAQPENAMTIVAVVLVAVLVALVVDRAARRTEQAARLRTEAALLASFSRTVLTRTDPLPQLLENVAFGLTSVAEVERTGGEWHRVAEVGPPVRHRGKLVGQRDLLRAVWGPATARRPTTCASTSRSCGASSRRSRPGPRT